MFNLYLNHSSFFIFTVTYVENYAQLCSRKKDLDEWLRHDVWRIGLNLFTSIARFLDVSRGIGASREGKKSSVFNRTDGVRARTKAALCVKFL